jgi:hypothetical protein
MNNYFLKNHDIHDIHGFPSPFADRINFDFNTKESDFYSLLKKYLNKTTMLQISLPEAQCLYPTAVGKFKELLEKTFGIPALTMHIIDRIKTYNDAMIYTGEGVPYETDRNKLKIIIKALNKKETPNFDNILKAKFYVALDVQTQNLTVQSFYTICPCNKKYVFIDQECAIYAMKQFSELFKFTFNF